MNIQNLLLSDPSLTLIGGIITTIFAAAKTAEWLSRLRERRFRQALEILEAAIEETYRTYVHAIKSARSDGKLTEQERRQARQLARQRAIELGRAAGIDILRIIGEPLIDLWLTKLVLIAKQQKPPSP